MGHSSSSRALVASILVSALTAACSGGSESAPAVATQQTGAPADARASAAAATDLATTAITWTQLESATAGANGAIVKAPGGWYSAAVSSQTLQADGALSFRANNVGTNPTVNASRVCLDSGTYDVNAPTTLDYCVVPGAGVASVYVRGAWRTDTPLTTSDVVEIAIAGASVTFRKNGTAFYAVAEAPALPLSAVFSTNFDGYGLTSATLTQAVVVATPAAPVQVPVVWGSIVQASAATGGAIVKTAGPSWYAAAASTQTLSGPGRLAFGVNDVGVNPRVNAGYVCLDSGTRDVNSAGTLDYCLVPGAGVASVYVRGTWLADTPVAVTDTLAISAEAGAVRFEKNGSAFFAVTETPAWPLTGVWTTAHDGYGLTKATITQNVAIVPTAVPVTWGSTQQAAANSRGGIVKTAGSNWFAAGTSLETLTADGKFEFTVNNVGTNPTVNAGWVCLDSGTHDVLSPGALDYCIVPGAGVATVYVRGSWRADAPVTTTDVLDIRIAGGTILFEKNGAVFYTVTEAVNFPLAAVWTTAFDGYGLTAATLLQTGTAPATTPPPAPTPVTPPPSPITPPPVTPPTDPAPTPTPSPTPDPIVVATGATATVSWDRITTRTDGTPTTVVGYRVTYGQDPDNFAEFVDLRDGAITSAQFSGFAAGTWWFAVVAIDADGYESAPSEPRAYLFQ